MMVGCVVVDVADQIQTMREGSLLEKLPWFHASTAVPFSSKQQRFAQTAEPKEPLNKNHKPCKAQAGSEIKENSKNAQV
jgi:hypothetical protein